MMEVTLKSRSGVPSSPPLPPRARHRAHHGVRRARRLEGLSERPEILLRRPQHLLAPLLPLLVLHLQQVSHERGVPLRVRELVRVEVAHGADDRLRELLPADVQFLEEVHRAVVVGHRLEQVRVAVAQVREHAAVRVEVAEAAVRAAGDAHAVPEPGGAEELVDDVRRAVELVPRFVQVRAFAHVVDLGGDGDELVDGREDEVLAPRLGGGAGTLRRERVEERLHRPAVASKVFASAVRFVTDPARDTKAARIFSRSATTPSQSLSILFARVLRYSSCARPPSCSLTYPATESMASSSSRDGVAADWTRDSIDAGLEHELLEDLLVVELGLEHHLGHEVVELAGLGAGGLAPEHEVGGDVVRAPDGGGERGEGETAGGGAMSWSKSTKDRLEVPMRCMAPPQGHEGHQVHGDGVKILRKGNAGERAVSGKSSA